MPDLPARTTREYKRKREEFKRTRPPCWLQSGPWCTGVGTTVDHVPPLSTCPPGQWQGDMRPACKPCQDRQGNQLRNRHKHPEWVF